MTADPLPDISAKDALASVARIGFASGMDAVWSELCAAMDAYGFDRLNYAHTPALRDPERASRSERLMLSSHPAARVREVYYGDMLDRSPMRIWAARNVGAMSWSRQPELLRTYAIERDGPALRTLLDDLGMHAGWTIGFPPSAQAGKAALGLTARAGLDQAGADAIWAVHGTAIEAIASAAHARLAQMPVPMPDTRITKIQREIAGWVADGKTIQDVALLTGRSPSAVEKHLAALRRTLETETTAQAIAKLALRNHLRMPCVEA